jgi:hypothetical protein
VEKHDADTIIESAKNLFSSTILLRSVRTREAKNNAVRGEKGAKSVVVKFTTIVSLKQENGTTKLIANKGMEGSECGKDIGLAAQWKGPDIMSMIIEYDKIILKTRITDYRRGPNVTMQ